MSSDVFYNIGMEDALKVRATRSRGRLFSPFGINSHIIRTPSLAHFHQKNKHSGTTHIIPPHRTRHSTSSRLSQMLSVILCKSSVRYLLSRSILFSSLYSYTLEYTYRPCVPVLRRHSSASQSKNGHESYVHVFI